MLVVGAFVTVTFIECFGIRVPLFGTCSWYCNNKPGGKETNDDKTFIQLYKVITGLEFICRALATNDSSISQLVS